ncbi:hypothetical protein Taro_037099 [Colocasia esculenta]|uniref:UspA domain-containing protein n=1 Tax=Colocasia esculenta TaxID=4460 RepID=A0A843WI79_COLES|nr:hypothetical protein [Colocasia esculenta]
MQGSDDGDEQASFGGGGGSAWEIEEVPQPDSTGVVSTETCRRRGLPFVGEGKQQRDAGEDVYVAVGKGGSSMDALVWALKQLNSSSGFVYLVHVFPEVHHIPTPLGMLPKKQVTPQQVETHTSHERSKRRALLHKYISLCYSVKVQVDTILIESDLVAKAILELIPVLRIRKLIMGTSKSNLRMIRRGSGKVGQVVKDVPEYCEVKIVCEGQQVKITVDEASSSPSPRDSKEDSGGGSNKSLDEERKGGTSACNCFSRKFM